MSSPQSREKQPPSPSQRRYRRESFWQITLPMLVVVGLVIAALVLVARSGSEGISGVADLSLIVASLPLLLVGLVIVVAIVGIVAGIGWLVRQVPQYTRVGQDVSAQVASATDRGSRQITDLFISAAAGFSMAQRIFGRTNGKSSDDDSSSS